MTDDTTTDDTTPPEGRHSDSTNSTDDRRATDADADADSGVDSNTDPGVDSDPDVDTDSEIDADPDVDSDSPPGVDVDRGADADPDGDSGADGHDDPYDRVVDRFGADPLTDRQVRRLPDHSLFRRHFFAGRDVDRYLRAAEAGDRHSVVTGVGPSGPMHVGHLPPLYLARRLQAATGAHVYVPLSDDEKFLTRGLDFEAVGEATRQNLRDVLAVGFDPDRTTVVLDTADADLLYPIAVRVADRLTQSAVEATYGRPDTVGESFYPAMQATHLLLPQLVAGRHPTLVPVAVDQDPHVRLCRDVAGTDHLPVDKPGVLLGRYLPGLAGPEGGKMSSSGDDPAIQLTDDPETVREKLADAYSGGRQSVAAHRREGGDPEVDVAVRYLRALFEPDDDRLARIERRYREGELLSGELKSIAADRIAAFLDDHQSRRADLGPLCEELDPFLVDDDRRRQALSRAGIPAPPRRREPTPGR